MVSLEQAAVAFCSANDASLSNKAALQLLNVLPDGLSKGKENSRGENDSHVILKCLKHAQHRFAESGHDTALLSNLSEALLQRVDNDKSAGAALSNQVSVLRYTFVRKLVSAKLYAQAFEQALILRQQLEPLEPCIDRDGTNSTSQKKGRKPQQQKSVNAPSPPTAEEINLAIGTTITLAVCWAEAPDEHIKHLNNVLKSATYLQYWTSFLDATEALKHSESLYKYLYRGSLKLVQLQQWAEVQATCTVMVKTGSVVPALEAVCKIMPHLPQIEGLQLAAACMPLKTLIDITSHRQCASGAASLDSGSFKVLLAASQLGNLLRKGVAPLVNTPPSSHTALAHSGTSIIDTLGGADFTVQIIESLEATAYCVASGSRAGRADSQQLTSVAAQFDKHAHCAVVAAVTALRLRALCLMSGQLEEEGDFKINTGNDEMSCIATLLGWSFPNWSSTAGDLQLPLQDLTWLASSVFNIGLQLLGTENIMLTSNAVDLLRIALTASITTAVYERRLSPNSGCVPPHRAEDIAKKAAALAEALVKLEQHNQALEALADTVSILRASGLAPVNKPDSLLPVVAAFVRLRFNLITTTLNSQQQQPKTSTKTGAKQPAKSTVRGRKKVKPSSLPHLHDLVDDGECWAVQTAELQAWSIFAAEVDDSDDKNEEETGGAAAVEANKVVEHLLEKYPAANQPVRHVQILLAAHAMLLSVGADTTLDTENATSGVELLDRAADVLESQQHQLDDDDDATSIDSVELVSLDAQVAVLRALALAKLTVQSKLEERRACEQQQRDWRREHPDRATDPSQQPPHAFSLTVQPKEWRDVVSAAENAVGKCSVLATLVKKGHLKDEDVSLWQPVVDDAIELASLLSLQGHSALEAKLLASVSSISSALEGIGRRLHGKNLASIVFDIGVDHDRESTTPTAAAVMDIDTLQQEATEAAASLPKSPATSLHREELWAALSRKHTASGDLVPALYAASEAHRIVSNAISSYSTASTTTTISAVSSSSSIGEGGGLWWQLASCRLKCLLRLGKLFEATGLADEAVQVLHEGQCLACVVGSAQLAAVFSTRLAEVRCSQSRVEPCKQALEVAQACLACMSGVNISNSDGNITTAIEQICAAEGTIINARLQMCSSNGDYQSAVLATEEVLKRCEETVTQLQDSFSAETETLQCSITEVHHAAAMDALTLVQAQALLTLAECYKAQGQVDKARQSAESGLNILSSPIYHQLGGDTHVPLLSSYSPSHLGRKVCRVQLQLLLSRNSASQTASSDDSTLCSSSVKVWGIQASTSAEETSTTTTTGAKARSSKGSKPTAAASKKGKETSTTGNDRGTSTKLNDEQRCWLAYLESKELPHLNRLAAAHLSKLCAQKGHLHVATVLLHCSLGATLRLQYNLVQYTRAQQQQPAINTVTTGDAVLASGQHDGIAHVAGLDDGLDEELVSLLAGQSKAITTTTSNTVGKSSRKKTSKTVRVSSSDGDDNHGADASKAALAALDVQAQSTLAGWLAPLPPGTAVCSISTSSTCAEDSIVVSRVCAARSSDNSSVPVIVELPASMFETSLLSRHPIRALSMDTDDNDQANTNASQHRPSSMMASLEEGKGGVSSVLHEMRGVLDDSTHSMRSMETETKDQQRAWWRARVELDERLEAVLQHVEAEWMGPWKCLLLGGVEDETLAAQNAALVDQALRHVVDHLASSSSSSSLDLGNGDDDTLIDSIGYRLAKELLQIALNTQHPLTPSQLRHIVTTACSAACSGTEDKDSLPEAVVAAVLKVLSQGPVPAQQKTSAPVVMINDAMNVDPPTESLQSEQALQATAGLGVLPSTAGPKRTVKRLCGGTFARGVTFQDDVPAPSAADQDLLLSSPIQGGVSRDLCGAFGSLTVQDQQKPALASNIESTNENENAHTTAPPPPPSTARVRKHKSRIAMMHTPAPKSARKPAITTNSLAPNTCSKSSVIWQDHNIVGPPPGTAPRAAPGTTVKSRQRPPATPGAPMTVPAAASRASRAARATTTFDENTALNDGGLSSNRGSVNRPTGGLVLVLDSQLQALPWESMKCLRGHKVYRVPSLPCATAAAAAARIMRSGSCGDSSEVDLASTYYAINPSGDLTETQSTFQDWFKKLDGWEGVAGTAPSAPDLARALRSRDFFVYFGHGGGEQYIPPGRLRALPRCAASLLMGCSSGKLQPLGPLYEPTGVVLAYLLAGCPTVVANLWDVTDRDIDRFSQSVLTLWLSGVRGQRSDVSQGVGEGREACKLKYLIGAAPVCYGLPTTVKCNRASDDGEKKK